MQWQKSPSTSQEKPSYLFVIMSNYGLIQQVSDGSYQLILDHGDVEKVLSFTNRPYRLVQHTTGEDLESIWSEGSNSFAEDPPNATVIINQHLQTVILTNMTVQGDKTIFTIESDGTNSIIPMSGVCQVFVDANDFTNRAYRLVQHTTGADLESIWSQGSKSFAEDPPNATVIINQHLQTVVLTNMTIQGSKTIFTLQSDGPTTLNPMSGVCQLFLDQADESCVICS